MKKVWIGGYVVFLVGLFSTMVFADQSLELIQDKTFDAEEGQTLRIDSGIGEVEIHSWDKKAVSVKILANEDARKHCQFKLHETDNGVDIITKSEFGFFNKRRDERVRYEVIVPRKYAVEVETAGGDVNLSDISGNVDLETAGGDIAIKNVRGEIELESAGGEITVNKVVGDLEATAAGGGITCLAIRGDIDISSAGGDLKIESQDGEIKAESVGGDVVIQYEGKNYGIDVESVGGDVDLTLPRDFDADLEVHSTFGSLSCSLPIRETSSSDDATMTGIINNGGEKIYVRTLGGRVRISPFSH